MASPHVDPLSVGVIDVSAGQLMAGQVIDYVAKAGKVAPKVEGRIALC
jgi:5'-nucleotidase / UDP-sugar diphosphatase